MMLSLHHTFTFNIELGIAPTKFELLRICSLENVTVLVKRDHFAHTIKIAFLASSDRANLKLLKYALFY